MDSTAASKSFHSAGRSINSPHTAIPRYPNAQSLDFRKLRTFQGGLTIVEGRRPRHIPDDNAALKEPPPFSFYLDGGSGCVGELTFSPEACLSSAKTSLSVESTSVDSLVKILW
jgi:hypothetical protein